VAFLDERANLSGRVAAVVGGAEGFGRAIALDLGRAGVDVAFCDINEEESKVTAAELEKMGRLVVNTIADVQEPATLEAFFDAFDRASVRLDILVNVVGGVYRRSFMDTTPEFWEHDARWNFTYILNTSQHAVRRMRAGGRGGSIINFTTIEAFRGAGEYAVYCAHKGAVTNFSRALALEVAADGIRVNCIAPDHTPSPGSIRNRKQPLPRSQPERTEELTTKRVKMYVPMQRAGRPEDHSSAVLFLASDLSSWVTGTTLHVDGGTWAASGFIRWPSTGFWPVPGPAELERLFPISEPTYT